MLAHILYEGKYRFVSKRDLFVFFKTVLDIELYEEQFESAVALFKPILERLLPVGFMTTDYLEALIESPESHVLRDTHILKIAPKDVGEFHEQFYNYQK